MGSCPDSVPKAVADETYGSIDGQGPQVMLRSAGEDWVLIAVNEYGHGVSFTISGLPRQLMQHSLFNLFLA